MSKELYIFSGLGADERVFQQLDFSGLSTHFIEWEVPDKDETIEEYAARLLNQVKSPSPILIGLSFGGMIAVEVAKQIDAGKVLLIASAKTKEEIPFYYRLAGKLGLHKLLPTRLLKKSNFVTNWFFGTTSAHEKELLKQVLIDTDPRFLKWAIDKIVRWANRVRPDKLIHIHGTKDRILPLRFVTCDLKIEHGGHLMTLNKADELTEIIKQQL